MSSWWMGMAEENARSLAERECVDKVAKAVAAERKHWEYQREVIFKIYSILVDGERALDPDADPEPDTNDIYDLVRAGVEARKKLAAEKDSGMLAAVLEESIVKRPSKRQRSGTGNERRQ